MKYIVKKHEVGLLYKNGEFIKALPAGKYSYSNYLKYKVILCDMRESLSSKGIDLALVKHDELLKNLLDIIHIKDNEIALHYVDENFLQILPSGIHGFFNAVHKHDFIKLDTKNPIVDDEIDKSIFNKGYFTKKGFNYITPYKISAGTVGILLINGEFQKELSVGDHFFWRSTNSVAVIKVDTRNQSIELNSQELLTKDKVTLRMNFICQYKIIDYIKSAVEFTNHQEQIYSTVQLALREYVSTLNLDELLAKKHEIGDIILDIIAKNQDFLGVKFIGCGVKDIILPGDIRDILNTVLIAEKKALANVITRREETASTRSLLNTAKLMDENKTLYKLKELEYLERICDKVGNISLSANAGVLEQLGEIIGK